MIGTPYTVANAAARVIEDSWVPATGCRLTTLQLRYPRFVHAEFMTHRMFSRNASSSRAIPVAKMLEQVATDPAMPCHWGKNQPGMQAREELTGPALELTRELWLDAARTAARIAQSMMECGAHKQVVNRILEPFQFISVIVSATEWDNFFTLRVHPDADPNMKALATAIQQAIRQSTPVCRSTDRGWATSWHLPYVTSEERHEFVDQPLFLAQLSTARCARVSYLNHDGTEPDQAKDLELCRRLVGSVPIHASPAEHPACATAYPAYIKNFRGFRQYRADVEEALSQPTHMEKA